jgi:ectoine hydroxylase-related dioxygenase (phytanoyl-CoA dioxygenase family)
VLTQIEALEYRTALHEAWRRYGSSDLRRRSPDAARFAGSRRIGRVVADLLVADGIRLYRDVALWDPPGRGAAPWCQDCDHVPLPGEAVVTMWMPLAPLPGGAGGLVFASGSHRGGRLPQAATSESGLRQEAERTLQSWQWPKHSYREIRPGDATFHLGTVLHSASRNPSTSMVFRQVMMVTYFVDGVRAIRPRNRRHEVELAERLPGVSPGDVAASDQSPLVYSRH